MFLSSNPFAGGSCFDLVILRGFRRWWVLDHRIANLSGLSSSSFGQVKVYFSSGVDFSLSFVLASPCSFDHFACIDKMGV